MVAVSLAALSLAVVGQTAFMIATYACYARNDTRSPLRSMMIQAALCLSIASFALFEHGWAVLLVLGLGLSAAVTASACHLTARLWRDLSGYGAQRLTPSLARFALGAVIMAGPAWLVATTVPHWLGRPFGPRIGLVAGAVVGGAVFLGLQAIWRTPEVRLLAAGFGHARGKAGPRNRRGRPWRHDPAPDDRVQTRPGARAKPGHAGPGRNAARGGRRPGGSPGRRSPLRSASAR